jgi:hypothetical protein
MFYLAGLDIWICINFGNCIRIRVYIEVKTKPSRVCRPMVADSDHFDEELDPDPH